MELGNRLDNRRFNTVRFNLEFVREGDDEDEEDVIAGEIFVMDFDEVVDPFTDDNVDVVDDDDNNKNP